MAKGGGHIVQPPWNPGEFALWSRRWPEAPNTAPTSLMLRHPTSPFVRYFDADDADKLKGYAFEYLEAAIARAKFDLPQEWLDAINPAKPESESFGWMPVGWPLAKRTGKGVYADPLVSYSVNRKVTKVTHGKVTEIKVDRTIILLASDSYGWWQNPLDPVTRVFLGSGFGIRVVADARWDGGSNTYEVRFTGMSATLPPSGYRGIEALGLDTKGLIKLFDPLFRSKVLKAAVASQLRLVQDSVSWRGIRFTGSEFEIRGAGMGIPEIPANTIPYSFTFRWTGSSDAPVVRSAPFVADAAGEARVFPRDPASQQSVKSLEERRPTRSETQLDAFRVTERITPNRKDPLGYPDPMLRPEEMRVVISPRFVREDRVVGLSKHKSVDLPGAGEPLVRSNDGAAIPAYKHVKQLFDRFERYSIDAYDYFRNAQLPLEVLYRSGVRPGPGKDGQTVNARVLPVGWGANFIGPVKPAPEERPVVEMHLALANLSHRARKRWDRVNRSPSEPLGIAADARWIWHEIGHVLLMARLGELEFRFAHSPGDALAAIIADPQSDLATNAKRRDKWRGATFPWVFIPRRHDRCVLQGWSWCGSMHRELSLFPATERPRRKGYRSEQILSSSLFRLYRCLGGDTTTDGVKPQLTVRESASHYSVYLIIRGLELLDETVPPGHVDDFVTALIQADTLATAIWNVKVPINGTETPIPRIGGCVHKVIRWAFEAQGLYAKDPAMITNAPGVPHDVDVYIEDGRPLTESPSCGVIQYTPGSYVPVSLRWDPAQVGDDPRPEWQVKDKKPGKDPAIDLRNGKIFVTVGNRGSKKAKNVVVNVWWREWKINTDPPRWFRPLWNPYNNAGPASQDIEPYDPLNDNRKEFGPFETVMDAAVKRYLVFAQATCVDDQANTDPTTGLPCSGLRTELIDLVPNDNNLGLRVFGTP